MIVNPFVISRLSYPYPLGEFIFTFRGIRSIFSSPEAKAHR